MNRNLVILTGRTGVDPGIKNFENGKMARVSLATTETWKDRQTGEKKSATEWHTLIANGKTADIFEKYVHKGDLLDVEGKIRTRSYQTKEGETKYVTEIIVRNVNLFPKSVNGGSQGNGNQAGGNATTTDDERAERQAVREQYAAKTNGGGGGNPFEDDDDDLPF